VNEMERMEKDEGELHSGGSSMEEQTSGGIGRSMSEGERLLRRGEGGKEVLMERKAYEEIMKDIDTIDGSGKVAGALMIALKEKHFGRGDRHKADRALTDIVFPILCTLCRESPFIHQISLEM